MALVQAVGDGIDTFGRSGRSDKDGLCFSGRHVNLLAFQRLGSENDALFAAFGDVDGALSLSFALEYLGSLAPLRGDLSVHGFDDGIGSVDVSDLVAQADDAPVSCCFVDCFGDVGVQGCSFAEDVVEGQATDFAAHGRLGQLADGVLGVFHPVAGFVCVEHPCVEYSI